MGSLTGQVALVTGGGRGLGRSIAQALAAEGAAVAIVDLFREKTGQGAAEETAVDIERAGGTALPLCHDVASADGARDMVNAVVERFGRVDILVTCAGNSIRSSLTDLTEQQWDSVISLHLKGHFLSCKMVLPHMLEQNSGRILTVASRGAFFQVPRSKREQRDIRKPSGVAYAAAKAGIMGLTMTLAVELWDAGINVNCLLPSATTQLFPDPKPRMVGGVPASNFLYPDDVAPAAVYLCSPDAADISGRFMYASGGDIVFYGEQLDIRGSRMVRKFGRWTQPELAETVPSLLGIVNV
jgi:3-oxoacyl-[acyl-carrier protein] reductase